MTVEKSYWQKLDESRARQYSENSFEREYELRAIAMSYKDVPEPLPCKCGAQLEYRVNVCAMQCPECRQLATAWGELIGSPR